MSEQVKTLRMLEDYFPSAKGIADHLEAVESALHASTQLLREIRDCDGIGIDELANQIAANKAALGGG